MEMFRAVAGCSPKNYLIGSIRLDFVLVLIDDGVSVIIARWYFNSMPVLVVVISCAVIRSEVDSVRLKCKQANSA